MELIKKRIHYVREGKKIFDQFYVDEDYNVPEAKEDVRRIVDTGTELKIEEIRPVENYVRITGKLYFRILYLNVSSDPKPGVLEGKLPKAQMKLVDAWMEIHKDDLAANWTLLSNGEQFFRIDPLK